ncbi:MAG: N-formylglutamate amidohydrolase [Rhodospirillales bacterium]
MDALAFDADAAPSLLSAGDPPPFEIVNPEGRAGAVLICDHAARAFPKALGDMGLSGEARGLHIAWDIGAAAVTRALAAALDAPAVLCGYSRLVIDCNRPPGHPEQIPETSDGHEIPGNRSLSAAGAAARQNEIFRPYHAAAGDMLGRVWRRRSEPPALFSVHSFTPVMQGEQRPWDAGVIWRYDGRIAQPLMRALTDEGLTIGDNLPYSGFEAAYSTIAHAEAARIAHAAVEIRQDHISEAPGQSAWAERLSGILAPILAKPELKRLF